MKKNLLIFIFIFIVSLMSLFNVWNTYFQQDEWFLFGKVIYAQRAGFWSLIQTIGFHFTPLSMLTVAVLFTLFHLQFSFYILFSIFIHSINALLVFFVCQKITKNSVTALCASVLFLVANASQQAVTWVAASFSILPATFFGLVSLLCFFEYVQGPVKKRFLALTVISLFVGLMWKEDIVFLFLFYPLYFIMNGRKNKLSVGILLCVLGVSYIAGRFIIQTLSPQAMALGQGTSISGILSVVTRMLLLPFQAFSQLYITPDITLIIAHGLMDKHRTILETLINLKQYGNNVDLFIEKAGVAAVSTVLSIIAVIVMWMTTVSVRKSKPVQRAYSILLFIILSALPFGLLPNQLGMESRHYYFPMVGASILGAIYIDVIFTRLRNGRRRVALVLLTVGYVGMNIYLNHRFINKLTDISRPRRQFVFQVEALYKKLPTKTIVFSSGDKLNVQSGAGEMLLVIFRDRFPSYKFLEGYFLWDLGSQGYKQSGDNGFGYFSDYQEMKNSYGSFRLEPENFFSFAWDDKTEKLIDSTQVIRQHLVDTKTN